MADRVQFYEVMEYFLRPENKSIWGEVQALAQKNDEAGLHAYVNEAMRLTSGQRNVRIATVKDEIDGQKVEPGNAVVMLLVRFPRSECVLKFEFVDHCLSRVPLAGTPRRSPTRTSSTRSARRTTSSPSATVSTSASARTLREPLSPASSSSSRTSDSCGLRRARWARSRRSRSARRGRTSTTAGRTSALMPAVSVV